MAAYSSSKDDSVVSYKIKRDCKNAEYLQVVISSHVTFVIVTYLTNKDGNKLTAQTMIPTKYDDVLYTYSVGTPA